MSHTPAAIDEILTSRQAGYIEGYAQACADMMFRLTTDSPCAKSYDPMTIVDGVVMHSYAFNLKDGGRHHRVSDYKDVCEITQYLLNEAVDWVSSN